MSTDTILPWIDVEADAGAFVHALIRAPAPLHVLGVSDFLSMREWVKIWSKPMRLLARYEMSTAFADNAASDSTGLSLQMSETAKLVAEFGYTLGDPDVIMPEEVSGWRAVPVSRRRCERELTVRSWQRSGFPVQQSRTAEDVAREDCAGALK